MRDFLDNLIDRHADGPPQIKPRLPSIFEPEVSPGGLDIIVPDSNAPEIEETDILPSSQVTIPTASPTVVESVQPKAARAPTVPAREEKPSIKAGLNESVFSLSPRETPTLPPPSQGGGEEGVRETNSPSDPLTLTLSQRERGFNQKFLRPSATLIAPVMGRVRHAHQQKPREHTSPNPQAAAEDQSPVKEDPDKPVFSLSPRERAGVRGANSTSNPLSQREMGLNEGFPKPSATLIAPVMGRVRGAHQAESMEPSSPIFKVTAEVRPSVKPSATLIAPVIPSVAGPERSTSQPEPIINVTIGRIEVRATMSPQKQAPNRVSHTPVMGLEEYLRRRSGGHDR